MILKVKLNIFIIIVAISCIILSFLIFTKSKQSENYYKSQDIYQHYKVSTLILKGENPYLPILNSNMKKNEKYPTYLAGFYYLMAPTVKIYPEFNSWLDFWKLVTTFFYAFVGFLIFYNAHKNKKTTLGVILALIWFFNRWSIYLVTTLSMDTITIALLLLSLTLIHSKPKLSLLTLGIQLSLKHLTIFLLPIFLLQTYNKSLKSNISKTSFAILPILLTSLAFLINSPSAYLKSVLFSATRLAESHFTVLSLTVGELFKFDGITERLPILVGVTFIYFAFMFRKINFLLSIVLVLLISITFNPVFFLQYQAWSIAVLLFYFASEVNSKPSNVVYK